MTKTTASALSTTELAAVLDAIAKRDSSLVADVLAQVDVASAIEKKGSNLETRKATHRKALAQNNKIELTKVSEADDKSLALGQVLATASDSIMERGFSPEEAEQAMQAYLSLKLVVETRSSIQDLVKSLVYRTMDLAAVEQGEEFPEHTNMSIDIEGLGKRFVREGCGRKEATVDLDTLAELVGPEVFASITRDKVVVTREIDETALTLAVLDNPELLEQFRAAVVPGDWKTSRLMVRDIPAEQE